ncbi:zinc ribbon domain-containing protein [Thermodesulfobacteriota bacterium]
MIIHEYGCNKCGYIFKRMFLIAKNAPFMCPECGDDMITKHLNFNSINSENNEGVKFSDSPGWSTIYNESLFEV